MPYWTKKEDSEDEIKRMIREKAGLGFNKLLEVVSVSRPTLYDRLDELIEKNEVEKTDEVKDFYERGKYLDNSRVHYYLTEEVIKREKHQASFCRGLIFNLIEEVVDPMTLFEDFKEKSMPEVEKLLRQNILEDSLYEWTQKKYEDLLLILKECTEKPHILHLKNVLSAYFSKQDKNERIEEIKKKDDDEIKKEVRKFYLASGPLLNQKKITSVKIILKHLIDMSFPRSYQDNSDLLINLINQITGPTYPSPCYNIKPKQITEKEKEVLIEGLNNILAMGGKKRYEKYVDLEISNAVILDGKRYYPTVIPWEGNDFYHEVTHGLPTPDSIIPEASRKVEEEK